MGTNKGLSGMIDSNFLNENNPKRMQKNMRSMITRVLVVINWASMKG